MLKIDVEREIKRKLKEDEWEKKDDIRKKKKLAILTKGVFKEKVLYFRSSFKIFAGKKKKRTHIYKRVYFVETKAEKMARKERIKRKRIAKIHYIKKRSKFLRWKKRGHRKVLRNLKVFGDYILEIFILKWKKKVKMQKLILV